MAEEVGDTRSAEKNHSPKVLTASTLGLFLLWGWSLLGLRLRLRLCLGFLLYLCLCLCFRLRRGRA